MILKITRIYNTNTHNEHLLEGADNLDTVYFLSDDLSVSTSSLESLNESEEISEGDEQQQEQEEIKEKNHAVICCNSDICPEAAAWADLLHLQMY